MPSPYLLSVAALLIGLVGPASVKGFETVRPLLLRTDVAVQSVLLPDTLLLDSPIDLERFLDALDRTPPDWKAIYGPGDDDHMDRLFELNRERDRLRTGKAALKQRVAFVWEGVVSGYQRETGGFRLAIGPKVIPTAWGQVRFKPYGLPSGLVAVPVPSVRRSLRKRQARGETIEVDLLLTGYLIPEESMIYDFAHEEPGQGMVMPVVHVERVDYFLVQ